MVAVNVEVMLGMVSVVISPCRTTQVYVMPGHTILIVFASVTTILLGMIVVDVSMDTME